jgi:hypothetical protein
MSLLSYLLPCCVKADEEKKPLMAEAVKTPVKVSGRDSVDSGRGKSPFRVRLMIQKKSGYDVSHEDYLIDGSELQDGAGKITKASVKILLENKGFKSYPNHFYKWEIGDIEIGATLVSVVAEKTAMKRSR